MPQVTVDLERREGGKPAPPSFDGAGLHDAIAAEVRATLFPKDSRDKPRPEAALQYLNALSFQEKQDFLLTFSSLAREGNIIAHLCYDTLRQNIDGQPVSDRFALRLAWEISCIKTRTTPDRL
jgi:hypothetical protein